METNGGIGAALRRGTQKLREKLERIPRASAYQFEACLQSGKPKLASIALPPPNLRMTHFPLPPGYRGLKPQALVTRAFVEWHWQHCQ